jgi:hypothetical protein
LQEESTDWERSVKRGNGLKVLALNKLKNEVRKTPGVCWGCEENRSLDTVRVRSHDTLSRDTKQTAGCASLQVRRVGLESVACRMLAQKAERLVRG